MDEVTGGGPRNFGGGSYRETPAACALCSSNHSHRSFKKHPTADVGASINHLIANSFIFIRHSLYPY